MTAMEERDFWQRAAATSAQRLAICQTRLDRVIRLFEAWRLRGEPLPSHGEIARMIQHARDV